MAKSISEVHPSSSESAKTPWRAIGALFVVAILMLAAAVAVGRAWGQGGQTVVSVAPQAQESGLLAAQLAEMQRSEDRLLAVILAMMGIAATVLVAFTAVALYVSDRQYQRDKDAIELSVRDETKSLLSEQSSKELDLRTEMLAW